MNKASTKSKGATSYKQTAYGIIPRSELLRLEVQGTKLGLDYIGKNFRLEITPDLIVQIHKIAFGWIFPDWAGKYRTIRVTFSGHEAVAPHQVPSLIVNFCADLHERLKYLEPNSESYLDQVIDLLAWFQHRFVWIHPFQDYNGRVARMLTIHLLLHLNLPPIEIKADSAKDRQAYLNAMYSADKGDYEPFKNLISQALNESFEKLVS